MKNMEFLLIPVIAFIGWKLRESNKNKKAPLLPEVVAPEYRPQIKVPTLSEVDPDSIPDKLTPISQELEDWPSPLQIPEKITVPKREPVPVIVDILKDPLKAATTPRGIRNMNPGNIEFGSNWQGMRVTQTDPRFIQFVSPVYGIRAIAKILATYKSKYGIDTIQGIISRWAPPIENDTQSYISSVSQATGVNANATFPSDKLPALIAAIIKHENGQQPYSRALIEQGISLTG